MSFRVSEVSEITGLSVRALHHYDAIGLLIPQSRSAAGYRQYEAEDLDRLQQILFYRELGVDLETIRRLLDDPNYDSLNVLSSQRDELLRRASSLDRLLIAVDQAILRAQRGKPMNIQDNDAAFDGFDPARYEEEVQQRWGETEAYAISRRRTKKYSATDWQRIRTREAEITKSFVDLLQQGESSTSQISMDVAERHRLHIDQSYYPCSCAMHSALAGLYLDDPKFREHWEGFHEGLTEFVSDAILANQRRTTGSQ